MPKPHDWPAALGSFDDHAALMGSMMNDERLRNQPLTVLTDLVEAYNLSLEQGRGLMRAAATLAGVDLPERIEPATVQGTVPPLATEKANENMADRWRRPATKPSGRCAGSRQRVHSSLLDRKTHKAACEQCGRTVRCEYAGGGLWTIWNHKPQTPVTIRAEQARARREARQKIEAAERQVQMKAEQAAAQQARYDAYLKSQPKHGWVYSVGCPALGGLLAYIASQNLFEAVGLCALILVIYYVIKTAPPADADHIAPSGDSAWDAARRAGHAQWAAKKANGEVPTARRQRGSNEAARQRAMANRLSHAAWGRKTWRGNMWGR